MKKLTLLTVCLFTFLVSQAQSDSTKQQKELKFFIVSIKTLDNKMITGRLYAVTDSQLVLANDRQYIHAEDIKSFSLMQRKHRILRTYLRGYIIGMAIGLATVKGVERSEEKNWGFIPGYSFDASGYVLSYGASVAIIGTALKAVRHILGPPVKEKYVIDGNKEKFADIWSTIGMVMALK